MKQILLILTIIVLPSLTYAGSGCEVVSTSLYDDVSGDVHNGNGSIDTSQCATVTIKNTSGGGRLSGKITAKFIDGKTTTRSLSFKSRFDYNQLYTTRICWSKTHELNNIDCEL